MSNKRQEGEDREPTFSLNDFKKWMSKQPDDPAPAHDPKKEWVGLRVESRVSFKRLGSRIDVQDGEPEEILKEFRRSGGTVVERDDQTLLIEVDSGATFYVPRCYVRPA